MSYPTWGIDKFNLPQSPATKFDSGMAAMTTPAADDPTTSLLHPHNPLLTFAVLAALAFGLMAASTSLRVGKTTATIQLGDTKK